MLLQVQTWSPSFPLLPGVMGNGCKVPGMDGVFHHILDTHYDCSLNGCNSSGTKNLPLKELLPCARHQVTHFTYATECSPGHSPGQVTPAPTVQSE